MSLKPGGGPKTLPTTLTIIGQGSSDKLDITYHNRKTSEVDAMFQEPGMTVGGMIPFIVESWSAEFPLTAEGVVAFEDEYPGIVDIVFEGFRKARKKAAEKN